MELFSYGEEGGGDQEGGGGLSREVFVRFLIYAYRAISIFSYQKSTTINLSIVQLLRHIINARTSRRATSVSRYLSWESLGAKLFFVYFHNFDPYYKLCYNRLSMRTCFQRCITVSSPFNICLALPRIARNGKNENEIFNRHKFWAKEAQFLRSFHFGFSAVVFSLKIFPFLLVRCFVHA